MSTPAVVDGYLVVIEFEERLDSRDWPSTAPVPAPNVKGPSVTGIVPLVPWQCGQSLS